MNNFLPWYRRMFQRKPKRANYSYSYDSFDFGFKWFRRIFWVIFPIMFLAAIAWNVYIASIVVKADPADKAERLFNAAEKYLNTPTLGGHACRTNPACQADPMCALQCRQLTGE